MINKIFKFLHMFGFITLSLICFLLATIVMSEANVDASFLYELTEYQISVLVFVFSGVIFLVIGISNMIYMIYHLLHKDEV